MANQKYFLFLLWIPFVPVIFYKDHVIRFIKEKSTTINPWRKADVWQSTPYLKVTKAKPTSNAMNTFLPQRSFHTTPTSKPKIPDVWKSPPYLRVTKAKPTPNATNTILPQRSPHPTSTSKQNVPVPSEPYNFSKGPTSSYYKEIPPSDQIGKNLSLDITVISAYFRLPPFPKGMQTNIRNPEHYLNWMKSFAWIVNPLIIYTDDKEICNTMTELLANTNRTSSKVILIRREDLWSFKQIDEISKIFKQNNYPVHYPNTVIPAYNCLTHAKLELIKLSIENNTFHTKYFIWVDIGYFRYSVTRDFGMSIPKNFDERRIGFSYVGTLQQNVTLQNAITHNMNYIAGGCFLGRFDVLLIFCNEYLEFVRDAIKQKWVGVEQQLLYAMYSRAKKPKTSLQLCSPGWFCMGKLTVYAWEIKQNKH